MRYPMIRAKHSGPERLAETIDLIVIHTMEAKEKPGTARAVARWFASEASPLASAHFCVDADEIIQCVPETIVAWGAPGANRHGIHIEHAGYASQKDAEWQDEYSKRMLLRSAHLAAELARKYSIPAIRLNAGDLISKTVRGFCGHVDVTYGRNNGKGHKDPGAYFPWWRYLQFVNEAMQDTLPNA